MPEGDARGDEGGDEVGMSIHIDAKAFDPAQELRQFTAQHEGCGAVVSFTGHVRNDGGRVKALILEHYPEMAQVQSKSLVDQVRQRWPLDGMIVRHRFGKLEPGDAIVFIAVAARHRQAAFDACQFLIDWMKTKAPFWKYEEQADGGQWVEEREADHIAARRWQKT